MKIIEKRKKNPFLKFFLLLILLEILLVGVLFASQFIYTQYKINQIESGKIICQGQECSQEYKCQAWLNPHDPVKCGWKDYQLNELSGSMIGASFILVLGIFVFFVPAANSLLLQLFPFCNFIILFFISYIIFKKKYKGQKFLPEIKRPINIIVLSLIMIALFTVLITNSNSWNDFKNEVRMNIGKKTIPPTHQNIVQNSEEKEVELPSTKYRKYEDSDISFIYPDITCKLNSSNKYGYACFSGGRTARSDEMTYRLAYSNPKLDGKIIHIALPGSSFANEFSGDITIEFIEKEEYDTVVNVLEKRIHEELNKGYNYKIYITGPMSEYDTQKYYTTYENKYLKVSGYYKEKGVIEELLKSLVIK